MTNSENPNNILDLQHRIGKGIRALRESKGIKNYEKFAIQNGFSRSHYWNIEQGEVNLTLKTLARILNSLDISVTDFFKEINEE